MFLNQHPLSCGFLKDGDLVTEKLTLTSRDRRCLLDYQRVTLSYKSHPSTSPRYHRQPFWRQCLLTGLGVLTAPVLAWRLTSLRDSERSRVARSTHAAVDRAGPLLSPPQGRRQPLSCSLGGGPRVNWDKQSIGHPYWTPDQKWTTECSYMVR